MYKLSPALFWLLAQPPATKEQEQQKGLNSREHLCLSETTWCPCVTNCPANRNLTILLGQEGLGERRGPGFYQGYLTTSLAIFKNLKCLTMGSNFCFCNIWNDSKGAKSNSHCMHCVSCNYVYHAEYINKSE